MDKLFIILLSLFLLSISCKKDKTVVCRLEGYVMDTESNKSVDSVKVELLSGGQSHVTQTSQDGYYNLGNFNIGDYILVFSKTGYLKISKKLDLTSVISAGNYDYEVINTDLIKLQPLQETLLLTVYRKYQNGEQVAATNFPFSVMLGDFNEPITGLADNNGIITIKNMPRQVNFAVDYTLNGIRYKTSKSLDVRIDNYVVVYGYNPEASFGLASTNVLDESGQPLTNFVTTSNITVQFTLPVDTTKSTVKILQDGWQKLSYTHKWTDNNMKLELDPVSTLLINTLYSLEMDAYNVTQTQNYSKLISFTTKK